MNTFEHVSRPAVVNITRNRGPSGAQQSAISSQFSAISYQFSLTFFCLKAEATTNEAFQLPAFNPRWRLITVTSYQLPSPAQS